MSKTGQDIVDDLRSEILEPSPTFFSNSRMLSLINLAQNTYVAATRILQSFAYTSAVQGQADYPMPTDWLGSEKVFFNSSTTNIPNWYPLTATSLEKLGQENPNFLSNDVTTQGVPRLYYVIGKTLYIYPRPNASGTNNMYLFYESKPVQLTSLAAELSIDDSLYPGVRAYVLWKLWKQDQEKDNAAEEKDNYKQAIGEAFKWKNKRILDGRWKIDIVSYAPFGYGGGNNNQTSGTNPLEM